MKKALKEALETIRENSKKILLSFIIIMGAIACFQGGMVYSKDQAKEKPLVIETPPMCEEVPTKPQETLSKDKATMSETQEVASTEKTSCLYVGSKNSDKYYPPSCSFAKRIKPENLMCFQSDEEAQKKGYKRSSSC
ncbi:MAG: hypothetical protein KC736_01145 [Candidatus Moranbacteria bacterium]|nr:hypothetical protein [Candidatus Moranbacteria bacterium]